MESSRPHRALRPSAAPKSPAFYSSATGWLWGLRDGGGCPSPPRRLRHTGLSGDSGGGGVAGANPSILVLSFPSSRRAWLSPPNSGTTSGRFRQRDTVFKVRFKIPEFSSRTDKTQGLKPFSWPTVSNWEGERRQKGKDS